MVLKDDDPKSPLYPIRQTVVRPSTYSWLFHELAQVDHLFILVHNARAGDHLFIHCENRRGFS